MKQQLETAFHSKQRTFDWRSVLPGVLALLIAVSVFSVILANRSPNFLRAVRIATRSEFSLIFTLALFAFSLAGLWAVGQAQPAERQEHEDPRIMHWESEQVIGMVKRYLRQCQGDSLRTPEFLQRPGRFRQDNSTTAKEHRKAMYSGIHSTVMVGLWSIPDSFTPRPQKNKQATEK